MLFRSDEAGRGPLAGPVCAAAVILPKGHIIDGVNDSKKLTEKKREKLFDVIIDECVSYSIAFATVEEIEELNIGHAIIARAVFTGLKEAVAEMKRIITEARLKQNLLAK